MGRLRWCQNPSLSGSFLLFSARCNIYISCLCYDVSVHLSVTEVHWRIIANLGFKFRSQFTPHIAIAVHAGASTELFIVQWARGKGSSLGRVEGSSRAMLATARPSCYIKGEGKRSVLQFVLEARHRCGSLHVVWDHTVCAATQHLLPLPRPLLRPVLDLSTN